VSLLADGLVDEGHEVTLFASGDSRTRARLEAVFDVAPSEWIGHTFWELRHAVSCLSGAAEYDVISDHTGLLGLALGILEVVLRIEGNAVSAGTVVLVALLLIFGSQFTLFAMWFDMESNKDLR